MFVPRVEVVVTSLVTNTRCAEGLGESDPALGDGLQTGQQRPRINGQSLEQQQLFIRANMTWRQIPVNKQCFYPKLFIPIKGYSIADSVWRGWNAA